LKLLFAAVLVALTCVSAVHAQSWRNWSEGDGKNVRVMANFQIVSPVNSPATTSDLTKALALANQSLYDIVNRQCEVIEAAMKSDCRIVQLNVNGNINDRLPQFTPPGERQNPQVQFVNANAQATFLIGSKDAPAEKDAPAAKDPTTLK
jgi:hypothetical protein